MLIFSCPSRKFNMDQLGSKEERGKIVFCDEMS